MDTSWCSLPVCFREGWICAGSKGGITARCSGDYSGYHCSVSRSMAWRNFRQANQEAEPSGVWQSGHPWDQDVLQNCFPAVHPCGPHRDIPDLFDGGRCSSVKDGSRGKSKFQYYSARRSARRSGRRDSCWGRGKESVCGDDQRERDVFLVNPEAEILSDLKSGLQFWW